MWAVAKGPSGAAGIAMLSIFLIGGLLTRDEEDDERSGNGADERAAHFFLDF